MSSIPIRIAVAAIIAALSTCEAEASQVGRRNACDTALTAEARNARGCWRLRSGKPVPDADAAGVAAPAGHGGRGRPVARDWERARLRQAGEAAGAAR